MNQVHEKFIEMEMKCNLFSLKTLNNLPVWDLLRDHVWHILIYKNPQTLPFDNKKTISSNNIGIAWSCLINFIKFIPVKGKIFIYSASRFKNEKGLFHDPYFKSIQNQIPENYILYETLKGREKYSPDKRIFNFIYLPKLLIKLWLRVTKKDQLIPSEDNQYIRNCIENVFDSEILDETRINKLILDFYLEYLFYYFIFKWKKIKKIFMLQNGYQKGLIYAANILNIPIYEFQHGEIVKYQVGYNYGDKSFLNHSNIIHPDVLLMYSDIWSFNKTIQMKCVEIGNDFFCPKVSESEKTDCISIISTQEHDYELFNLAIAISELDRSVKIYYKLHPAQYENWADYRSLFSKHPNVQIVTTEYNMSDLLEICDHFIGIFSTALFEALQAKKIVYIYKRQNYFYFDEYFDLSSLYLFDDATEFLTLKKHSKSNQENLLPVFFKPYSPESFQHALSLY